ncbi:hypothetical protein LCGC14_1183740 [marine sediment metagenome]|uniref:Uncharacterized protein n=1 Tax=marine sediment metagenome TaxID=412755 RepID=A0A0F9M962_9ZZZZ
MSKSKWHKNCGGKVVYQKPIERGVGFEQAGLCLKCDEFPILQEDIIFEIDDNSVERLYEEFKEWRIIKKEDISESLDN